MSKIYRLIVLLLVILLPVNVFAKVVSSVEYNGYTYDIGYVCDFQVDGIPYTIQDKGVYVSAQKYLCDTVKNATKLTVTSEAVVNNSYKGVVTIPETVNYGDTIYDVIGIDKAAFKGCINLDQIEFPISLIYIGASAFYGCTNLRQLHIPFNVSEIDYTSFEICIHLDTIYWDSPLVSPRTVMTNCPQVRYFEYGSEINNIPSQAFDGNIYLTSITIPEKVEYLGEYSFNQCMNLKKIEFEGSPVIYEHSFSRCYSIDTIVLKSRIPPTAINKMKATYGYDYSPAEEFFADSIYENAILCIPEGSYNEYAASELWSRFSSLNRLNPVDYNGHSYYIKYKSDFQVDSIFYKIHDNGVYVSAEKYLCDLENDASSGASEIVFNSSYHGDITIPEKVMFNDTVYKVMGIDMAAFKDCKNLYSVAISDNVREICECAFSGCSNLKTVKFSELLSTIKKEAFKDCISLESVAFPKYLKKIGESSFRDCNNLKSLFFQNGYMDKVGKYAFAGCTGLNYINIPSAFSSLFDPTAFNGCIIDSVYWNSFDMFPTYLFSIPTNCIMKHVYIDDARDHIYSSMFDYCNFFSVTISANIRYVESCAFSYCNNLNKIVMEGCPDIYDGAFICCDNIDSIVIKSSKPPRAIDRDRVPPLDYFNSKIYENAILCIPKGSIAEYMSSPLWSRFRSVQEMDFGETESDSGNDTIYNSVQGDGDSIFYTVQEDGDTIFFVIQEDGLYVVSKSFDISGFSKTFGFDGPLTPRDPIAGGQQPRVGRRSSFETSTDTMNYTTYSGSVVIPEWVSCLDSVYLVTGLNYYAFVGSRELESVSLPESVKHLGYGCFAGCSGLKTVNIPSSVKEMPDALFYGCSSLGSVEIPDGVITVGHSAFYKCTGLTKITIPESVELIDEYAFAYCSGLKRVIIEGNPEIAETAFIGCGTELEVVMTRVEKIKATDTDVNAEGAVHYGVDGRKIPADAPGFHIIKYKNGAVGKVWVR